MSQMSSVSDTTKGSSFAQNLLGDDDDTTQPASTATTGGSTEQPPKSSGGFAIPSQTPLKRRQAKMAKVPSKGCHRSI